MDAVDRKILAVLQEDGRISNADLADRVRLTQSPCLRRVRRLEEAGVIRGYAAQVDPESLGFGFQVFVSVSMQAEDQGAIATFEQQLGELVEVLEAYRLFGEPDYLLRVGCKDIESYERFYSERLTAIPGVRSVTSHMVMKKVKEFTSFLTSRPR